MFLFKKRNGTERCLEVVGANRGHQRQRQRQQISTSSHAADEVLVTFSAAGQRMRFAEKSRCTLVRTGPSCSSS